MAEDANTQPTVSSTDGNSQPTGSTSQGGADSTSQKSGNEGYHNDPRFREVISEKNHWKQETEKIMRENAELKARYESRVSSNPDDELINEAKREFEMDDAAARKFVSFQNKIAEKKAAQLLQPLSETTLRTRADLTVDRFYKKNPEAEKMENEMKDVLRNMDPHDRAQVLRMSDGGLGYLYKEVKLKQFNENMEKSRNEGRQEAYENKQQKTSLTSSSSSSSAQEPVLSPKQFADEYSKLSEDELKKNAEQWDLAKRRMIGLK